MSSRRPWRWPLWLTLAALMLIVPAVAWISRPWWPSLAAVLGEIDALCELPADLRAREAALDGGQGDETRLRRELASLEEELLRRRALCRIPPEPPPPQVAQVPPPPPPPPPPPQPVQPPPPPPPPPPVQQPQRPPEPVRPPPGTQPCDTDTRSGGFGVTRTRHFLGPTPGRVTLDYNTLRIPDAVDVYYRGRRIATTQGPVSGRGQITFDWRPQGNDYVVEVVVVGDDGRTEWGYRLNCPNR